MRIGHTDNKHQPVGEYRGSEIPSRETGESQPWRQRLSRFLDCERRGFARMLGLPAPRPCRTDKGESQSS